MTNPLEDIRNKLKETGNEEKAKLSQRFFKTGPGEYGEGDVFIGVTVPKLRKLAKEHKTINRNEIRKLLQSEIHEERLLSLFLLIHRYSKGDESEKKRIYEFYLKNTKFVRSMPLIFATIPAKKQDIILFPRCLNINNSISTAIPGIT